MRRSTDHRPAPFGLRLAGILTACLVAGWQAPAQAAIVCCDLIDNSVESGKTAELVFVAWDGNGSSVKVQYTQDLGLTIGDFFVSGQQDTGSRQTIWLGGAEHPGFASFLDTAIGDGSKVDPSKVRWAVFAYDTKGNDAPGDKTLFTTLLQPSASEAQSGTPDTILGLSSLSNDVYSNMAGAYEQTMVNVNLTGTHRTEANGWSITKSTDQLAYAFFFKDGSLLGDKSGSLNFGVGGTGIPRTIGNTMGQSSWFYAVTASDEFDSQLPVKLDEFDNLSNDGYWGLAPSTDPAHPGEYLLSYTLNAITSQMEVAQGVVFANSFAHLAGLYSLTSPAGKAASTLTLTQNFLRGLARGSAGVAAATVPQRFSQGQGHEGLLSPAGASVVPEPASALLWLAGLGLGLGVARRRR